jgi:hypothetical protein
MTVWIRSFDRALVFESVQAKKYLKKRSKPERLLLAVGISASSRSCGSSLTSVKNLLEQVNTSKESLRAGEDVIEDAELPDLAV